MQGRILLVDDEPSILFTLSVILGGKGYEVETAASGKEALAVLESKPFHLILTDMRMETDTAGYEVIRAAVNTDAVIAILTAYPARCHDWCERGAQALWEKPIDPQQLLQRIETLLAATKHLRRLRRPA